MKPEEVQLLEVYDEKNKYEIGIDESGRGPLFGRLYVAGVILPKDGSFCNQGIKDSKKIHSKKKIKDLADFIKKNSVAWHIHFVEPAVIDEINIRQAVLQSMHECITQLLSKIKVEDQKDVMLLVDGNDFIPYTLPNDQSLQYETIEGGDNLYLSIAAASILAKVERDAYIQELCEINPDLSEKYKIHTNMGYGTKHHLEGIKNHGITEWHRKSYRPCSEKKYKCML